MATVRISPFACDHSESEPELPPAQQTTIWPSPSAASAHGLSNSGSAERRDFEPMVSRMRWPARQIRPLSWQRQLRVPHHKPLDVMLRALHAICAAFSESLASSRHDAATALRSCGVECERMARTSSSGRPRRRTDDMRRDVVSKLEIASLLVDPRFAQPRPAACSVGSERAGAPMDPITGGHDAPASISTLVTGLAALGTLVCVGIFVLLATVFTAWAEKVGLRLARRCAGHVVLAVRSCARQGTAAATPLPVRPTSRSPRSPAAIAARRNGGHRPPRQQQETPSTRSERDRHA